MLFRSVMSVSDVPAVLPDVSPATAEIPVSTETPAYAETPASAMAPSTQYVQTGEKPPKLSAVPSRQEVARVTEVLLSNGTPFCPIDVVHSSNYQSFTTQAMICH